MLQKTINDNIIRLTGTASIPEPLEIDHDYKIEVLANVVKGNELRSRQDGTYDQHFSLKILTCEIIKNNGERLRAKDKRSISKKLRGALWGIQTEYQIDEDEEEFYQKSGNAIIANLDSILKWLKII